MWKLVKEQNRLWPEQVPYNAFEVHERRRGGEDYDCWILCPICGEKIEQWTECREYSGIPCRNHALIAAQHMTLHHPDCWNKFVKTLIPNENVIVI